MIGVAEWCFDQPGVRPAKGGTLHKPREAGSEFIQIYRGFAPTSLCTPIFKFPTPRRQDIPFALG